MDNIGQGKRKVSRRSASVSPRKGNAAVWRLAVAFPLKMLECHSSRLAEVMAFPLYVCAPVSWCLWIPFATMVRFTISGDSGKSLGG